MRHKSIPYRAAAAGLLAALAGIAAPAQARAEHEDQLWLTTNASGAITGRLVYSAELQARLRDGLSSSDQTTLRGTLGWKISPRITLAQGYAYIISPKPGGPDQREHRSFQQFDWSIGAVGPGSLSARTRLEQRWRERETGTGWRLRQRLRYGVPLTDKEKSLKAVVWSEGFVGLSNTDWETRTGFYQMRNFLGVEIPIGGKSAIEGGYTNQYTDQVGPVNRMSHIASITLQLRH